MGTMGFLEQIYSFVMLTIKVEVEHVLQSAHRYLPQPTPSLPEE